MAFLKQHVQWNALKHATVCRYSDRQHLLEDVEREEALTNRCALLVSRQEHRVDGICSEESQ